MTNREKLIELVKKAVNVWYLSFEGLVDYLISNGVTVQKWIPVSERLPVHGDIVLCYTKYREISVFQWDSVAERWLTNTWDYSKDGITHWREMPEPPKECE